MPSASGLAEARSDASELPGHWEGDLIIGLGSSAIGTLTIEIRTTRFTHAAPPAQDGRTWSTQAPIPLEPDHVVNGMLAGHGCRSRTGCDHFDRSLRSLTSFDAWSSDLRTKVAERGGQRRRNSVSDTGICKMILRATPACPWQRGTNENTATGASCVPVLPQSRTDLNRHSRCATCARCRGAALNCTPGSEDARLENPHPKPSTNCYSRGTQ